MLTNSLQAMGKIRTLGRKNIHDMQVKMKARVRKSQTIPHKVKYFRKQMVTNSRSKHAMQYINISQITAKKGHHGRQPR